MRTLHGGAPMPPSHLTEETPMQKFIARIALALAMALPVLAIAGTPVNINKADAATIAKSLDGIGQSKADAIVAYRDANGPFKSADDLTQVKGIGKATLERNRASILLADAAAAPIEKTDSPAKKTKHASKGPSAPVLAPKDAVERECMSTSMQPALSYTPPPFPPASSRRHDPSALSHRQLRHSRRGSRPVFGRNRGARPRHHRARRHRPHLPPRRYSRVG
jgi:competence protein ComEA